MEQKQRSAYQVSFPFSFSSINCGHGEKKIYYTQYRKWLRIVPVNVHSPPSCSPPVPQWKISSFVTHGPTSFTSFSRKQNTSNETLTSTNMFKLRHLIVTLPYIKCPKPRDGPALACLKNPKSEIFIT